MAARYAVTTGNWTGAIWAATAGGAAGSAAVPTSADDVTINKNVTVTIDDTSAAANTLTLSNGTTGADVGGILTCTTTQDWKLTLQNGITTVATANPSNTATYTSSILFDMSAAPAYTGQLVVNNAGNTTTAFGNVLLYGNYVFKGASRKRHSVIESALVAATTTQVYVTDATGWKVNDYLVFATTSAWNATPRTDLVQIDSITFDNAPTNTGRALITWSESLAYAHASGCPVGNFTSNLIFRPATNNARSAIIITSIVNQQSTDCYMDNVALGARISGADYGCYGTQSPGGIIFFAYSNAGPNWSTRHKGITNNSFYQYRQIGLAGNYMMGPLPRNFNIFFSTHSSSSAAVAWSNINGKFYCDPDEDYVIFASVSGIQNTTTLGTPINYPGCVQRRHKISGIIDSGNNGAGICTAVAVEDCDFWSNSYSLWLHESALIERCRFDEAVFSGATSWTSPQGHFGVAPTAKVKAIDCEFGSGVVPRVYDITSLDARKLTVINRNPAANGAAIQEIFQYQSQTVPAIQRNTATVSRSTSSMEFTVYTSTAQEYEFEVLAKAGETIKLLVLVRKSSSPSYGASTLPKVTISGLDITPVVATMDGGTAADAWETLTVEATNTGSADGNFTVTFTAQSATAGAKAFFAGIPTAPFITRCRHYGYLFNETSPTREVNPTIDTGISEATALAYGNSGTDLEVTWGASSTLAVKVSSTFKKVYHFTQADGCLNVGSAMPLTGAGLDDSPALFAAGNVTVSDGAVLNGSGSISMGAYTLATEFASGVNYTYTGGAFSQVTTVPTFSGGTLTLPTAITTSPGFTMATGAIVFNATSALWDLSTCTIDSGVTLSNTSGAGITVAMPAGYPTTTIGSGATEIIVTAPAVERGFEFVGLLAGSFVRVVKNSDQSELFADTNSATTETWDDATSGSLVVDYVIMKNGYDQIHVTGVTVTGAVGTGIQTVTVSQTPARWYQASSGLTINTNAFANATTKLFGLTTTSTLQNFASYLMEQWITLGGTGGAFANKPFPLAANGPNSFSWLDGWEADLTTYADTITNLYGDGMRYIDTSGNVTAVWCAILTSGVPTGEQVRFQQSDPGTTVDADNTGEMDQLVQIISDPNGNGDYTDGFDRSGYLVLKIQAEGYDQAESNVVTLYGNLEDQLYVVGLTPTLNGIATGNPTVTLTLDRGTYNDVTSGKTFGIRIVSADSGEDILRELRYNFGAGGEYPAASGYDGFDWHDLVQVNGADFKTVRGNLYGTAAVKGVVVYSTGTTLHPDFTLFTADDGTTYAPAVTADISITSMPDAGAVPTRLQIINSTATGASAWAANTIYATSAIVKRTTGLGSESTAGLYFRATTGGTSHATTEPTWDTTVGNTTADGTVVWTTYAILYYDDDPAATSLTDTYIDGEEFLDGESVEVRFAEMDGSTSFKTYSTTAVVNSAGFSVLVSEDADDVYATNALDGSDYEATFSPNFTLDYMVLDTNTDFSGKAAFAYYCYTLTTSAGMWGFWGGVTALDEGNYRVNTAILNLYFDESAGFVKQTDNVRIFRDDGLRPAIDPTTGGHGIEINWRTPVSTTVSGSGVTAQDKVDIIDGVWSRVLPL